MNYVGTTFRHTRYPPITSVAIVAIIAVVTMAVAACTVDQPQTDNSVLVTNVNIVDLESCSIQSARDVLIEDGKIKLVTNHRADTSVYEVDEKKIVRGHGRFALPGYWDMHLHFGIWPADIAFPALLKSGVLGARDMGWEFEAPVALRDSVTSGARVGPRLVVAGPILDGPTDGWPLRHTVSSVDEAAAAVAAVKAAGADFIKVHAQMERDVFFAVAKAANEAELPFVGHLAKDVTVIEAVAAGQASIEHLIMPWCELSETEAKCVNAGAEATIDVMVAAGTRMTATLPVYRSIFHMDAEKIPELEALDKETRPLKVQESWDYQLAVNSQWAPPEDQREDVARKIYANSIKEVRVLTDAGIPIMVGSDLGYLHVYPGTSVHDELSVFVNEAGLTPCKALNAAISEPVRFLGLDEELGGIAAGKEASFIMLDGNPLEDIANSSRVSGILLRGHHYDPDLL